MTTVAADVASAPEIPPAITDDDWSAAVELVRNAHRILLCTHRKPDGDAIGSLLGLGHALESGGKQVTLACADRPDGSLATLPGAARIVTDLAPLYRPAGAARAAPRAGEDHEGSEGDATDNRSAGLSRAPAVRPLPWDLIISLDASALDRLGALYDANRPLFERLPVIDLDHHFTNDRFGNANLVDPGAASATEVITLILERLGITPNVAAATCLLAGMMTDSLSFQTESTTPRTLRLAASLVEAGAPISALAYVLLRQRPMGGALLWSKALGTLQFAADGKIAWIEVTRAMIESSGPAADSGGLSGFAGNIAGVQVGMALEEGADGNVYVGLRSQSVDIAAIAAQFGGGGHKRAAGCHFLSPATIADARAKMLAAIEAALAAGE